MEHRIMGLAGGAGKGKGTAAKGHRPGGGCPAGRGSTRSESEAVRRGSRRS